MHIAIIGSGIAGLSCAHALTRSGEDRVTVYEAAGYLGGHTNTIDLTLDGITHPVDTGFLVFNERTYPRLIKLLAELGVTTVASEMSFSVSLGGEIEWAGTSLATVFAQPANLLRPRFLRMLADILRFNRAATRIAAPGAAGATPSDGSAGLGAGGLAAAAGEARSLGEFLTQGGYSAAFRDWYLLPMAGAIWSCPTRTMLDYPVATFARFCLNHGLLQVTDRPQWRTVQGGAREYVKAIARTLGEVRLNTPVRSVRRIAGGVEVQTAAGSERYDQVVLACHSDQALALLAEPGEREGALLGAIRYQPNLAYLHTDTALLPRRRNTWAAWNYLSTGAATLGERPVAVSYLINRLQPVPFKTPVIVTLNPFKAPAPVHVHARIEYAHPVFDAAAIAAQQALPELQGEGGVWFAGAWTGYGFHEDGLASGLAVARALRERTVMQAAA